VKVAVVCGGPSSEADVSRTSAAGVARALEEAKHEVARVELDADVAEHLKAARPDVVFPVVHGAFGEDGSLQGLLELLAMPYVGADVLASAMAMNKEIARTIFASAGLPIARGVALKKKSGERAFDAAKRVRAEIGRALVVKPASNGSAIGVARFGDDATDEDVARGIDAALALDDVALCESFVVGREVTCSVLDVPFVEKTAPRVLAATEIASPMDAFYTYQARYAAGRSAHTCPAELGALERRVHEVSLAAHMALGCRDLSRVDFVVTKSDAILLEVNTLPGMTETSLFPEAAAKSGLAFPVLCDALVKNALARGARRRNAALPMP
jgi:D-alanine-D-alanine ligase